MTGDCTYAQSFDVTSLLTILSFTTLPILGLLACLIIVCVRNRRERMAHLALQGNDDDSDEDGDEDGDDNNGNDGYGLENNNSILADPVQPSN